MDEETYQRIAARFDELSVNALRSEADRIAFRTAWLAYLETEGITDDEFDDAAMEHAGWA